MRPHRTTVLYLAVLGLLGPGLAGCGGGTAAATHANHTHAGHSAPTELPATGELDTRCTDPGQDTAGSNDDLSDVAIVSDADQLVVAFAFTTGVPTRGSLLLTIEAHSQDGTGARQLGVQLTDGHPVGAFVATSPTSEPVRLDDTVHVTESEVHAAFPASALRALGPHWTWFAMSGDESTIADFCPGSAGTSLNTVRPISVS